MQLRCTYCQTMFAISREEKLAALEHMAENNLKYYDAHCPKCRRANRVERFKLELSYPGWQADLKAMAKDAAKAETVVEKPAVVSESVQAAPAAPSSRKKTHAKSQTKSVAAAPSPKKKPAAASSSPKAKKPARSVPSSKRTASSTGKKK